ncbi:MAG: hypothetical protein FWC43_10375 [Planctomycetaceae bacterium]|nr:hypothetical protein [Planctomycetaceae bacterium]
MSGYEQTIRVLTRSNNRAASELLKLALDSSHAGIRKSAYAETIFTRGPKTILESMQNCKSSDDPVYEIFAANPDKLVTPIRTALLSKDHTLQKNAVRAVLQFKVYDMIPTLLFMLSDRTEGEQKTGVPIAELLIRLTKQFIKDIEEHNVPDALQRHILRETRQELERNLKNFRRSDDPTCIKVFLLLGRYVRDKDFNAAELFRNPIHPVYTALSGIVQAENHEFVFKFILDSLEAPTAPGLILATLSNRTDLAFLEYLFENMDLPPSSYFQANVQRVRRFDWLTSIRTLLPLFSEKSQQSLLDLIRFSDLPKGEVYAVCRQVYQYGKSAGRCAALTEIANFPFEESKEIVLEAVDDEDPNVQATALRQIRKVHSTLGMVQILQKIDSPHEVVREAVRVVLPEFQIRRFLNSFDQFTEEQRIKTLKIIQKVDPTLPEILALELQIGNPEMKARVLKSIEIGNFVGLLEEPLCTVLLRDESVVLRAKAAALLADGKREVSRLSLLQASHKDTSLDVRLTAKASLEQREKK